MIYNDKDDKNDPILIRIMIATMIQQFNDDNNNIRDDISNWS
jgi:hypothetical protein